MTLVEPRPDADTVGPRPESVVITLDAVSKVYRSRRTAVPALDAISLTIPRHGFTCVVGASGCGKSTLLNLLAGLDSPTSWHARRGGPDGSDVPGVGAVPVAHGRRPTSSWRSSCAT